MFPVVGDGDPARVSIAGLLTSVKCMLSGIAAPSAWDWILPGTRGILFRAATSDSGADAAMICASRRPFAGLMARS